MGNVAVTTSAFPADACFGLTETQWNSLVALLSANFVRAGLGVNYGNQLPAPEHRDKPWHRLHPDGRPDRVYNYSPDGLWLSRFFVDPPFTFWYTGAGLDADIGALHGGEVGTVGDFIGPFWKKVAGFEGRSPMVPGTLGSGASITVGADYGAEEFSLTALNLPTHFHDIIGDNTGATGAGDGGWLIGTGAIGPARDLDTNVPSQNARRETGRTEGAGELAADIDPISNVHPVRGVWFLERTARLYHRYPP